MMTDRRKFIAALEALAVGTLAGCIDLGGWPPMAGRSPTARFSMDAVDDTDIARRGLSGGADDDAPLRDRLLRDIRDDDEATVGETDPPLPDDRPVFYDGTVYHLDREVTGETPATRLGVDMNIVDGDEPEGRTVAFSDLPAVDRRVFERYGLADGTPVDISTSLLYPQSDVEQSELIPETEADQTTPPWVIIEWPDVRAEWVVHESMNTSMKRYRYTVAETSPPSEIGADIREQFEWVLSDLSAAERDIVGAAIEEDGYVVGPDENPPPALQSLVDRFNGHDRVSYDGNTEWTDGVSGDYLARYEGTVYWITLSVRESKFGTSE